MIEIDVGAQKWIAKTARKNYWRVYKWYDLDDLIQDGIMHYYRIAHKYPQVESKAHLMRLFQVSYLNYIHDLARQKTNQPDCLIGDILPQMLDEHEALDLLAGAQPETSYLQTMIDQAPQSIRSVLELLGSDAGRKRLRGCYRLKTDGHRETLNERLCRLTGINPDVDLPTELSTYFQR